MSSQWFRHSNQWLALALLVWLLLISSWLFVRSDGVGGRPLNIVWSYDPALFDPHQTTDPVAYSIFRHVCEPLFYEDFDGAVRGLVAEDNFKYTDDGRRLLVYLRPGITFHDGTPLTAAAVQMSFQRLLHLGNSPLISNLKEVKFIAHNERLIEFALPFPDYDFVRLVLSNPYAVIISPNTDVRKEPGFVACTGPYRFAPELYQPEQSLALVRYGAYQWPPAYFANRRYAYIPKVQFLFQTEAEKRVDALLRGDVCVLSLDRDQLDRVSTEPHLQLYKASGGVTYLGFNFLQPRWQDVRLRQAVAMAINKVALAAMGPFDVADTPLNQAMTGYDSDAATYAHPHDPQQSRQQLQAVHFDPSAEIILLLPQSNTYRRLAEAIVQDLAAVGINNVRLREASRAEIASQRQQFDLLLFDYAWGDYTALAIFLGPGPRNLLSYPNGDVAELIQQARMAATDEQRQSHLLAAQRIVLANAIWQPLVIRQLTFAVDSRCVQDERQSPFGELLFHDAWTQ
ncbi:MAG: ABC transporter substrate-binding protein [Caldilinea sp. CFX5]|nr:ABC transporter substrate-binding protein [Caldilinea sp. CFX5]